MASTRKAVAALEVFENPCTPAVADEHDFMHKYDLAFLWGYYSTTAGNSQLVNEMRKPPT